MKQKRGYEGNKGKQGKMHCHAFFRIQVANHWCQKKVMFIFCTMKFIIDQNYGFGNAPGYLCGNLYSQNISRWLYKHCHKVLKNKKQYLIVTC